MWHCTFSSTLKKILIYGHFCALSAGDVFKTDTNSVRQVDGPPIDAKRGCCVIL
jgi:hypothetical protein